MRTTLTLDDDVFEAAQTLSRTSGRRLGEIGSELLRRALKPAPQGATRSRGRRFPVFDVPRDAKVIPASRIQRVLDDEGIV